MIKCISKKIQLWSINSLMSKYKREQLKAAETRNKTVDIELREKMAEEIQTCNSLLTTLAIMKDEL